MEMRYSEYLADVLREDADADDTLVIPLAKAKLAHRRSRYWGQRAWEYSPDVTLPALYKDHAHAVASGVVGNINLHFPPYRDTANTVMRGYGQTRESTILCGRRSDGLPRALSVDEGKALFGLPDAFRLPRKYRTAFGLLGNSIVVPQIHAVADWLRERGILRRGFSFADLFAGIGTGRAALEAVGGECVASAELDAAACDAYLANWGEYPRWRDVHSMPSDALAGVDAVMAGFPCQAFSRFSRNPKGFADARGTLFFELARLLDGGRVPVAILENVQNLLSHDGGRTFEVIWRTLREIGYRVEWRLLDAHRWTAQHRERVFIVGIREGLPAPRLDSMPVPPLPRDRNAAQMGFGF